MGIPTLIYGEGVKIKPDMIPDVTKQPDVIESATAAGKLLGQRLRDGHDRMAVTQKMQQTLMAKFKESA